MRIRVRLDRSPEAAIKAVEVLTNAMEVGRPGAWTAAELGERYAKLVRGVIAFRAEVLEVTAKFKLGQNEQPDVLVEALNGVRRDGGQELHRLMTEANAKRLVSKPV